MTVLNPAVDHYLAEGCGRCALVGTPECKVHRWPDALNALRRLVMDCGLVEELKWSVPCYTYQGHNIVIVAAFKGYCALSFFKGALLSDTQQLLKKPGENTQAARIIPFTNVQDIVGMEAVLKAYIFEAIEVEQAGLAPAYEVEPEPKPAELLAQFKHDPSFQAAFEALTPGRQRGYILHFSQAKQSATRSARIAKYMPKILEGKGLQD